VQLYLGKTNGSESAPTILPHLPMSVENTLKKQPTSKQMSFVLSLADHFLGNSQWVACFLQAQHDAFGMD